MVGKKKRETRKKREEGPSATEALIFLDESPLELRLAQKGGLSGVFFLVLVFGFFFVFVSFVCFFFYWNFFSTFVSFTLFFVLRVEFLQTRMPRLSWVVELHAS